MEAEPRAGGGDLLIVDDLADNLVVLADVLREGGYPVRAVRSGRIALQAARREPPALVLLDVLMPEMDGYEVCRHFKADEALKGIPVIFISAATDAEVKVKAFTSGGVDFISKPFAAAEVLARVRTHLALRGVERELERRLAEHEQRYEAMFRGCQVPQLLIDPADGRIVDANPAAAAYYGWSGAALKAMTIFEIDSRDREAVRAAIASVGHTEGTRFQVRHRLASGELRNVEVFAGPVVVDRRFLNNAFILDITEQRRALDALSESESRYRSLVDTQVDMVVRFTPEGMITFVNNTVYAKLEPPVTDLVGESWTCLVDAEDRSDMADCLEMACVYHAYSGVAETRYHGPHGLRWYSWEINSILHPDGTLNEIQATGRDITEHKRADDERRNQVLFLHTLIEAIPAAVFYKDVGGAYLGCNRLFADFFGRPAEEIIGRMVEDLVPAERAAKFIDSDHRVLRTRQPDVIDFVKIWDEERTSHIRAYKAPFDRADGSPGGLIGILLDLTTDMRREEELRQAKLAAELASRAKSAFVANTSHEIRTPMNAILGLVHLLDQTELTALQRDYVAKTRLSAQSLLAILNDILDFSKVEADRLVLEAIPFRLDELMTTLATLVGAGAWDKDIELLFDIAADTPLALVGDPLRLQQVLMNLVSNAIKFTARGEVVLSVAPGAAADGEAAELCFVVRDTGIGIAADEVRTIFDAFSQADSGTSRRYGGSGLGLAIARRLVALMGGTIAIDSEPGRGSTFTFTARFRRGPPPPPPPAGPPLRLLLAESHPGASAVLAAMAGRFGWRTATAASATQALALFEAATGDPFGLALLDGRMFDADGGGPLAALRERCRVAGVPLLLTAPAYWHDRIRAELKGDAILVKPVTPSMLFDAVTRARASGGDAATPHRQLAVPLAGLSLLLVEDNSINQMVAGRLLESAGATVDVVGSGAGALAALAASPGRFDAVLMDIQMPGMDGYETTREIRARLGLKLPVIAMTANALPADRERSLAAGMNDHVSKPLDIERLYATICNWTHRAPSGPVPPPPVAAAPPELPDLDLAAALRRVVGDRDLLKEVMADFVTSHAGAAAILERDIAAGDHAAIARFAHDLRTLAGNVGALPLSQAATALQAAARRQDATETARCGGEVIRRLETALRSVKACVDGVL